MSPEDASVHASVLCRSVVVVCCDCELLLGIATMRLLLPFFVRLDRKATLAKSLAYISSPKST